MKNCIWLSLILLSFITSCKREIIPADQVDLGKDYFPLVVGRTIEYSVDSVIYNAFAKDTEYVHLEFKDEIVSQFYDNEGRDSYVIERSARYDSNDVWQEHLTYYATQTNYKIEVVENNLRFIKLIFPVKTNTSWKGNVYIPASTSFNAAVEWYDGWDYRYKNINEDFDNGILNLPNSVVVSYSLKTNDTTGTDYNDFTNYKESYSRNIGLTYRELTHWEFQPTEGFRNGFSYVMRAKKYY